MKCIDFVVVVILTNLFVSCNHDKNKEKQEMGEKDIVHHIASPSGTVSSLPVLYSNRDDTILSWITEETDSMASLNYSYLVDGKWQEPKEIIRGEDWFINWADFPMISENNGNLISHVLKKSSKETFSYDIHMNLLPKGQSEWATNIPLHTDGTKTEHGFVTALPFEENSFFITWLDGRNSKSDGHAHDGGNGTEGAMNIRAAEISPDGTVSNNVLLDSRTCSCCQTTAAMTSNGPVVLYRDRSEEEIRDISITRMVNGKWTEPKAIYNDGWKINGCPVNGPKAAAIGNNLVVAWFTAAKNEPRVKVAFSADDGGNFDDPILVGGQMSMGRVDVLMIDGDNAIVSWMESTEGESQLKVVKINRSGKKSDPVVIGTLDASRKTGFPQMELVDDRVYFAWTDIADGTPTIAMAYVMLKKI